MAAGCRCDGDRRGYPGCLSSRAHRLSSVPRPAVAYPGGCRRLPLDPDRDPERRTVAARRTDRRSEEHTSELQSRENLVCRLLLEKKNRILLSTPHRTTQ